jgi:periplasmic divalent cation tolerance protein
MADPEGPHPQAQSEDAAADAEAQLSELRDSFRPRLAERVGEIEAAWEALRSASAPSGVLDLRRRLHRLAHSLAGAAGTFGFPAVGDAARTLERRLQPVESTSRLADPGEIADLVAALRQAADATLV